MDRTIAPHALGRLVRQSWLGSAAPTRQLRAWAAAHREEAAHFAQRDKRLRLLLDNWKAKDGKAKASQ